MVIAGLRGGLGNQMFQYSAGRRLAARRNTTLGLDLDFYRGPVGTGTTVREYALDGFNISASIAGRTAIRRLKPTGRVSHRVWKRWPRTFPNYIVEQSMSFDPRILNLSNRAYLDGYWQSEKYFADVAATLRAEFTLKQPLDSRASDLAQELRSVNSVALHVRRGDYVGHPTYYSCDHRYYERAIDALTRVAADPRLYVFSDDVEWCRQSLRLGRDFVAVDDGFAGYKATGHLDLMRSCRHFIIANSSFSWWAAWLATHPAKRVFAPQNWFMDPQLRTDDLVPPTWVQV